MEERHNGIVEVVSSNPIGSTSRPLLQLESDRYFGVGGNRGVILISRVEAALLHGVQGGLIEQGIAGAFNHLDFVERAQCIDI